MMKFYKVFGLSLALWATATLAQAQNGPCTGSQYVTDAQFFRATASAVSSDVTASKKKATGNARTSLTNQIATKGDAAAKTQSKIAGTDMPQLVELIQIAIRQEAMNMKVVCENSDQANGKYNTSIVVELTKAKVLSSIIEQVKSEAKIKANFEEEKFRQAF